MSLAMFISFGILSTVLTSPAFFLRATAGPVSKLCSARRRLSGPRRQCASLPQPARPAVDFVAGVAGRPRGPAEAALLIALADRGRAAIGRRSILAIWVVESPLGAPDDVRRQGMRWIAANRIERSLMQRERTSRFEETERILDFPDQIGSTSGGEHEARAKRRREQSEDLKGIDPNGRCKCWRTHGSLPRPHCTL